MKPLRIALTKGRLEKKTIELFEELGYNCDEVHNKGRKLIMTVGDGEFEVVLAKAADVITYVEHGVCDLGVVGKDTILENGSSFYELLDLGFGKCRFALAGKKNVDFYHGYGSKTVATKYPNVTRKFFESKNMDVQVIKIEGSVELAPLVGLSDGIVDIVETGSTLKANHLEVKEYVTDISARLIANTASLKLRKKEIEELVSKMEAVTLNDNNSNS
ncbi:MAG: ATP phosphoribosyltransferase [Ruminococcus sp.]|nr:ATP phosphoribosyltransferase [Ruminococcus sp.]